MVNGVVDDFDGGVVCEPEVSVYSIKAVKHSPGLVCAASVAEIPHLCVRHIQRSIDR